MTNKRSFFLFFSLLLLAAKAPAQDSLNMIRLARWDDDALPVNTGLQSQYSGCWGLTVNGREIAVLGGALHVLFFDVTDPARPKLIGKFAGNATTVVREYKSYKNRIYGISDGITEGLMIFDLSQAPDTIIRTYWSTEFFDRTHTITLDTVSGRIYLNGSNNTSNGVILLDISKNPDKPTLISKVNLEGGYVHDAYVRNDTFYVSSGYEGYYVFDFKDPLQPKTLASISTAGYNHNSWLSRDGAYAYYTEEIPKGLPIKIVDLRQLTTMGEIEVVNSFVDPQVPGGVEPIPHNVYIRDQLLFDSQYEDGLLVYDLSVPTQPKLVARYDTHPENTGYNGYYGCWGNYPWFPSGTIVAGDMQNGLQVLKLVSPLKTEGDLQVTVFPNPTQQTVTIQLAEPSETWSYRIFNAEGRLVKEGAYNWRLQADLDLGDLASGMYFLEIRAKEGAKTVRKLVVV